MTDIQPSETSTGRTLAPEFALWEAATVISSCLIVEWIVFALGGGRKILVAIPVLLALAFMVCSHLAHHETLRSIGFRLDNFPEACRTLLLPTLGAVALIVLAGWWLGGTAWTERPFRSRFLLLPLWALFQQYALQGFINRRLQMGLGAGLKTSLIVGLLFGVLHLPNPVLSLFTVVGGIIWANAYQKVPNLFAVAASHTIASLALAFALPPTAIGSLRVGFKYFG